MRARAALPLVQPLELRRPSAPLRAYSRLPYPFMLHSGLGGTRGRWSFFGADPFAVFRGGEHVEAMMAFRRMAELAPELEGGPSPFTGGAVGYWSYDYARRLETLPTLAVDDTGLPDFVMALYDVVGAYDSETRQAWLFSSGLPLEGESADQRAAERMQTFVGLLRGSPLLAPEPTQRPRTAECTFTPDGYRQAVREIQEHIRRGDIFQANLSQRWRVAVPGGLQLAPHLYEALVNKSPAPFMAYFDCGDHALLSASPERFLELRSPHVEARPIKGTRPRGRSDEEDQMLAAELASSDKDRAENVMIVDVLRNDLGRVCEPGSIEVPSLCELEVFPQVHHLTSTVTGRLRDGFDGFDLLHACFPGGSITGAPKLRAMEILEGLEPVRRHVYTGAIGWLSWEGDADWNIAIRTGVLTDGHLMFAAGGGITADSDPDAEYRESLDKAEGMRQAFSSVLGNIRLAPLARTRALVPLPLPRGARIPDKPVWVNGRIVRGDEAALSVFDRGARDGGALFETVRVYDGRPFAWERHLERLVLSAAILGFPVPPAPRAVRDALDQLLEEQALRDAVVRLTVTRGIPGSRPTRTGAWMEAEPLAARLWAGARRGAAHVMFSGTPFAPGPLGAHKTTSRLAWDLAREEARMHDVDEALLVSPGGHALEGAASNLFVVTRGEVRTPPLAQGVLPGVTRAHVLELCAELEIPVREAALTRADLDAADELFLTNSVQEVLTVGLLAGRALPAAAIGERLREAYRARVAAAR